MNDDPRSDGRGELHVVFGGGQVGSWLAGKLARDGRRVRVAKRSPVDLPEGGELRLGDADDPGFCREAAAGAVAVYHCMNPPYDADLWARHLPRWLDNLVAAAGDAGARLVVLENLYMVGRGDGGPIDEETPFAPESRKGEIRARLAEALVAAHRRGDVRAVSGRASDFYGPRGEDTHFGSHFWPAALEGKPASFLPDASTPHTYHFIPDVAEGLMRLGTAPDDVTGGTWMLPCAPAESTRALVDRFEAALGREIRLRGLPRFLVKPVGLFVPMIRELGEMLHQWDAPFVVDDGRYRERFGGSATDPEVGAAATVAWARARYGGDRAQPSSRT